MQMIRLERAYNVGHKNQLIFMFQQYKKIDCLTILLLFIDHFFTYLIILHLK